MRTREERIIDVDEAVATLRLEGMEPTDISLKYAQQYIDGAIDVREMERLVMQETLSGLGVMTAI